MLPCPKYAEKCCCFSATEAGGARAGAGELAALVDEIEATAADDSCGDMEEGGIKSLRNLWNRSATFVGMVRQRPF